jgi:hypothetical protein
MVYTLNSTYSIATSGTRKSGWWLIPQVLAGSFLLFPSQNRFSIWNSYTISNLSANTNCGCQPNTLMLLTGMIVHAAGSN